jgi:Xaa-Pro dipeptidase
MSKALDQLIEAEQKAATLFREIENTQLIRPGKTEREINQEVYDLAFELFGIKKYWHKRIVRAGENTLFPYDENPENLIIKEDDIVFLDFGPIFEDWEADYGRTYVLGEDPLKHKLASDIEAAWKEANAFFHSQKEISGATLYQYCFDLASAKEWEFGGPIAGHLIGHFPHEN